MSVKAYILIDTLEGKEKRVFTALRGKPGIVSVNCVEGSPNIIMLAEAEERRKLAKLTIQALSTVEALTSDIQCLPVSN